MMTKEELASQLTGREYGSEITDAECAIAKESGLVVVFGYSDDNCEIRGAWNDELSCCDGGEFKVNRNGVIMMPDDEERRVLERFGVLEQVIGGGVLIEALWCKEAGYSWTYKTELPHAAFHIMEDGDKFCRGIVFSISDLPTP